MILLIDRDYIDSICPKCKDHGFSLKTNLDASKEIIDYLFKILYLIFDYPYKHYTFKYFEV